MTYNPNEPRDAQGRWTAGANSGRKTSIARTLYPNLPSPDEHDGWEHMTINKPIHEILYPAGPTEGSCQETYGTPADLKRVMEIRKNGPEYISVPPDKDSQECVALVKAAIPSLGPTKEWRKGSNVSESNIQQLQPGVAIGYGWDKDGHYPSNKTGNHVALVSRVETDEHGNTKVTVFEQWRGHSAREETYPLSKIKNWSYVTKCK